jgi:hypothetical protein
MTLEEKADQAAEHWATRAFAFIAVSQIAPTPMLSLSGWLMALCCVALAIGCKFWPETMLESRHGETKKAS